MLKCFLFFKDTTKPFFLQKMLLSNSVFWSCSITIWPILFQTLNIFYVCQVIYQTKGRVFDLIFKHWEVGWKKKKPSFECLIQLLKALVIVTEIQSKISQNVMIITGSLNYCRITHANLLHSFVFSSWIITITIKLYSLITQH